MQSRHFGHWPAGQPNALPPVSCSVFERLQAAALRWPDRLAIGYYGGRLSYGALLSDIRRLAGFLHGRAGIRAGDRVVLCLQNCPQFVVAYYAVLAANAVVVPITPMSRQDEIIHVLQDSGARAVIFGADLGAEVGPAAADLPEAARIAVNYADALGPATEVPATGFPMSRDLAQPATAPAATRWKDALATDLPAPVHDRQPDDWCMIPYSSGSTGRPKGCLHSHATVGAVIEAYPPWFGMVEGARVLASLPFCHVTGMQHSMNVPLATGATIHMMTRWDPRLAADLIEREKIMYWRSITTMMIDFLSQPDVETRDFSALQAVGGGGAQMPRAIADKMARLLGLDYVEAYGLTETAAPTHINPPQAPKSQCLGVPIFGVDSRIVDPETGRALGPGEAGEIVTHGPQVFLGYWNRAEETTAAFVEIEGKRFFRTGDIGMMDEEGYFHFVDRLKRMVSVSGLKVWPAEVEAVLHSHGGIEEACVVGDPDPRTGEAVRAVVVPRSGAEPFDGEGLKAWCRSRMAAYKVPRCVEIRADLPRSGAGKVLWKQLQRKAAPIAGS